MSGWQDVNLKSVTSIIGDGLHGTPKYDLDGEYYFINGNNLGDRKIVFSESTKKSSKEEYLKYRKKLSDRTILLSINGTIGNVAFYNYEKVFLGKSVCYLNVLENVDKHFIYYTIKNKNFQDYIISLANGSTIKNVSLKLVRDYILKLPSLGEQRAIAVVLGALDDKIEMNKRMNETLEATAQALFKSWFVDFDPVNAKAEGQKPEGMDDATAALFPSNFTESPLGPIPEGWEASSIGVSFKLTMGQSPPGETYNENGEGVPFFQGRTDFGFRFPIERIYCSAPTRIAEQNDTLVSVRAPVGDVNIAWDRCCIGRGVAALRHNTELSHLLITRQSNCRLYLKISTVKELFSVQLIKRILRNSLT